MSLFEDLGLAEPLARALVEEGYTAPTPIQDKAIPHVLSGRDVVGIAQTGTGKTAAFVLPILHHLAQNPRRPEPRSCRVLILSPTRELSGQIRDSVRTYGRHMRVSFALAIGGLPIKRQIQSVSSGVDILVATPGRLRDLMQTGSLRLDRVEVFVLDEADRMLDIGFIADIRAIAAKLPRDRQTLLFSATMPRAIADLASALLQNPAHVSVTPEMRTADRVDQKVFLVDRPNKIEILAEILKGESVDRALIFTRTKRAADQVVRNLALAGVDSAAIHGNKSQNQRDKVLDMFRSGRVRTLIATDIAARGIDVDGVSHVVNFNLPEVPETYVHRIGRTARAGAEGTAISFCDHEDRSLLIAIEKAIRMQIPVTDRRSPRGSAQGVDPVPGQSQGRGRPSGNRSNANDRGSQNAAPRSERPYKPYRAAKPAGQRGGFRSAARPA